MTIPLVPDPNDPTKMIPDPNYQPLGSGSPPIPPIEPPTNGPNNQAQIDEAALNLIREQNARIQALNDQLIQARTAPPPAPELSREERDQEFYKSPSAAFDSFADKIVKRLEQTVAPLQEQYAVFKRDSVVDGFVNQAKVDPRIARHWNPQLEAYVRQQLANTPPAQVNEQTFINLAVNGVGLQALGQLPGATALPSNNNPPAPPPPHNLPRNAEVIPPHLRPTNTPPAPPAGPNGGKVYRDLTEDEARLARELRMTKEDYLDMLTINKSQVAITDIGKRA